MAHALFHKNQRVYVRPVGTWAIVERVVPHWTKGLDEPIRIFYDVGLGREFSAEELQAEAVLPSPEDGGEVWRILRVPNRWQAPAETTTHPFPGTYPVVVTGEAEWGGWRVPGAEYALSPARIERQARVMASAPRLVDIVKQLAQWAKDSPVGVPEALAELMAKSGQAMTFIDEAAE
jgi:hypothetical protein